MGAHASAAKASAAQATATAGKAHASEETSETQSHLLEESSASVDEETYLAQESASVDEETYMAQELLGSAEEMATSILKGHSSAPVGAVLSEALRRHGRPLQLGDVEASVERFALQNKLLSHNNLQSLVVLSEQGPPIPIDIGLPSVAPGHKWIGSDDAPHVAVLLMNASVPSVTGTLDLVHPGLARESFLSRLTQFLGIRRTNVYEPSNQGYLFEVSTKTPYRRIHYSPAYFFNPRSVFGSPTSPIRKLLQPGIYVFGAYPEVYWDFDAEYTIPGHSYAAFLDV